MPLPMKHRPQLSGIVQCSQAEPQTKSSQDASIVATPDQAAAFRPGWDSTTEQVAAEWVARGVTVWTPPNCHTLTQQGGHGQTPLVILTGNTEQSIAPFATATHGRARRRAGQAVAAGVAVNDGDEHVTQGACESAPQQK